MKNKKLIFIGIGLVGAYLLYKKYGKKKYASDYKNQTTCENAGYNWGILGKPLIGIPFEKQYQCYTDEQSQNTPV